METVWIFSENFIITILVYIVVALSLNLEAGFTGIPNFGKHLFVYAGVFAAQGIGVRLTAFIIEKIAPDYAMQAIQEINQRSLTHVNSLVKAAADPATNRFAMPLMREFLLQHVGVEALIAMLLVVITILLGMFFGIIASYAAVRLKEDYLAILLLSFAELMVMVIFYQVPWLSGGNQGIWAVTFTKNPIKFALIASGFLAALSFLYAERIVNSPMGRAMRAVRDDEIAASVFGRDVARIRLKVIMVASAMAALAGFTYIQITSSSLSISFNRVAWTFLPWAMIILGGMANNWGAVLGTVVFLIGMRLFEYYQVEISSLLHLQGAGGEQLANILVGVLILIVLYLRPQGILPERPSRTGDFHRIMVEEGE